MINLAATGKVTSDLQEIDFEGGKAHGFWLRTTVWADGAVEERLFYCIAPSYLSKRVTKIVKKDDRLAIVGEDAVPGADTMRKYVIVRLRAVDYV